MTAEVGSNAYHMTLCGDSEDVGSDINLKYSTITQENSKKNQITSLGRRNRTLVTKGGTRSIINLGLYNIYYHYSYILIYLSAFYKVL